MTERKYKQNNKTVGDKWAEGSDEWGVLHTVEDDGFKAPRDISCSDLKRTMDDPGDSPYWKTGALPRGGEPRYSPKGDSGTHQRGPNDSTYSPGKAVSSSFKGGRKEFGKKRGDKYEE